MREYKLPGGALVPPELQEQIADDVRAFDAAQTPEARSALALRKIGNELPRLRQVMTGAGDEHSTAVRKAVAAELMALFTLGYSSRQIRDTGPGSALLALYGLAGVEPEYGSDV